VVVPSCAAAWRSASRKIGRLAPSSSTQRGPSCRLFDEGKPPGSAAARRAILGFHSPGHP
jgi:hypothetical protein